MADESGDRLRAEWTVVETVKAHDHLARLLLSTGGPDPGLGRRCAAWVDDDAGHINPARREIVDKGTSGRIVADDAGELHRGTHRGEVRGHVCRPAGVNRGADVFEDEDRRLACDAQRPSVHLFVGHDVADHEDTLALPPVDHRTDGRRPADTHCPPAPGNRGASARGG